MNENSCYVVDYRYWHHPDLTIQNELISTIAVSGPKVCCLILCL